MFTVNALIVAHLFYACMHFAYVLSASMRKWWSTNEALRVISRVVNEKEFYFSKCIIKIRKSDYFSNLIKILKIRLFFEFNQNFLHIRNKFEKNKISSK